MHTKRCELTIKTTADGQESSLVRIGALTEKEEGFLLEYNEEGAQVAVRLSNGKAVLQRKGEYELYLPLEKGESVGEIGFGGSTGSLVIQTQLVQYAFVKNTLTVALQYDLQFGEEKQQMQLYITARIKE